MGGGGGYPKKSVLGEGELVPPGHVPELYTFFALLPCMVCGHVVAEVLDI